MHINLCPKSVPFPLTSNNGEWQVPDEEKGLHTSGHACSFDLLEIARQIRTEVLIPVHSKPPDFYIDHLSCGGVAVIPPTVGGTIEV